MMNDDQGFDRRDLRLERLERQVRRARNGLTVFAAVVVGALSLGATSSALVPKLLASETFRLVDDEGVLRGLLESDHDGNVVLSVVANDGAKATRLVLRARDPRLAVFDAEGAEVPISAACESQREESTEPQRESKPQGAKIRWGNPDEGDEDDDAFDWAD